MASALESKAIFEDRVGTLGLAKYLDVCREELGQLGTIAFALGF